MKRIRRVYQVNMFSIPWIIFLTSTLPRSLLFLGFVSKSHFNILLSQSYPFLKNPESRTESIDVGFYWSPVHTKASASSPHTCMSLVLTQWSKPQEDLHYNKRTVVSLIPTKGRAHRLDIDQYLAKQYLDQLTWWEIKCNDFGWNSVIPISRVLFNIVAFGFRE